MTNSGFVAETRDLDMVLQKLLPVQLCKRGEICTNLTFFKVLRYLPKICPRCFLFPKIKIRPSVSNYVKNILFVYIS